MLFRADTTMASFGASDTSETDTDTDALGIGRARGPAPAPALSPVPASPSFGMGDTTTDAESSGAEGLGIGPPRPSSAAPAPAPKPAPPRQPTFGAGDTTTTEGETTDAPDDEEPFVSGFGDMGSDTEDEDGNVKLDADGNPRKSRWDTSHIPDNWKEGLDPDDERLRGGPFYRDPNFKGEFTVPYPDFKADMDHKIEGKCHYAFLMGNPCHWICCACDYGMWEEYVGFRSPVGWQKGMHPEVADTLWEVFQSDKPQAEKDAVYKHLADMCRLSLGEGTEWDTILKWTRTGNRYHDKMVEGSKLPTPKNVYGHGCKKGKNFSVGVMIGFERGDLLYGDAAEGLSKPPFNDYEGNSLEAINAGEDNCMVIYWMLDPHYGQHRLYMWVCHQYSARQQWGIWNRIINKPLLREGYVPPPPNPEIDPRAPKVAPDAPATRAWARETGDLVAAAVRAIQEALRRAFPGARLVQCGVPRLDRRNMAYATRVIARANAALAEGPAEWLDLDAALAGRGVFEPDGIHLTEAAYRRLGAALAARLPADLPAG